MMHLIQIAGPASALSEQVERRVNQVIADYGLACSVEKISDLHQIIALQVFAIPGVIVDGELKSVGRVPEVAELVDWLGLGRREESESS
jgi:hypothetical protein